MTHNLELPPAGADGPAAAVDAAAASTAAGVDGRGVRSLNWLLFVYAFATLALMLVMLMPAIFSLAYKIQEIAPATKETSLGLVASIGAAANIVAAPLFGRWSDRSRLSWGRRRPFLILGLVLATVGFTLIAAAPSVALVAVGWSVAQVGAAAASTAFAVIIVDFVPEERRGRFAAFGGVATQLAGVMATLIGAMLTFNVYALFLVPAAMLAVAAVLYWFTVPDVVPSEKPPVIGSSLAALAESFLFDPRKERDFALVWLGKFVIQFGLAFFSTYQLYYLLDRLGFTPEEAGLRLALVGGIGIVVTSAGAVASGMLSDKLRRRKIFIYVAAGLFAAGLVTVAFAQSFPAYAAGGLLVLAAAGVFGAVDVALASDVIPAQQGAKFMNIYGTSAGIPGALAPAVAPLVLAIGGGGNYTALYLLAAGLAVIGGFVVVGIRGVR